jgi:palmitoyltransferase
MSHTDDWLAEIRRGNTAFIKSYLREGGNPSSTDTAGVSLLEWSAYYGDVSAVDALLAAGAPAIQLGPNFDLNGAVFHGHVGLVRFLSGLGADVNFPLPDTLERPLHAALCKRDDPSFDEIVGLLLEAGADPNCTTKPGVETGSFMRDVRTRGETPLHRAAAFGSIETINALLAAGAKIDARDVNGDSPLSWASWHLRPRSILKLLCFPPHRVPA